MNTIAVIIPCYNGWKYMNSCLESLEKQTVLPEQVIVVDDCSKDDSYEQLTSYAAKSKLNIEVIKNEENSGPSISRKNAVKKATADYFVFCDCDDWYDSNFIEEIKKTIDAQKPDLIYFDNYKVYKGEKTVAGSLVSIKGKTKEEIMALCQMSLWRIVASRKCVDNATFPKLYYCEDGVVLLQIIDKAENIVFLDKPFYNYLYREDSASAKVSPRAYGDSVKAFGIIEKLFKEKYPAECEYLGIKYLLYNAVICGMKSETATKTIKNDVKKFFNDYPCWHKNKYMCNMSRGKRLYFTVLRAKLFFLFPIMAKLHSVIVKRGQKKSNK